MEMIWKETVQDYFEVLSYNTLGVNEEKYESILIGIAGRAIAQAVSRRLPTAAARVQTRVRSCGIL
jgi:hypothetical protein